MQKKLLRSFFVALEMCVGAELSTVIVCNVSH